MPLTREIPIRRDDDRPSARLGAVSLLLEEARVFDRSAERFSFDRYHDQLVAVRDVFSFLGRTGAGEADRELAVILKAVPFETNGLEAMSGHFLAVLFDFHAGGGASFHAREVSRAYRPPNAMADNALLEQHIVPTAFHNPAFAEHPEVLFGFLAVVADFVNSTIWPLWPDTTPQAEVRNLLETRQDAKLAFELIRRFKRHGNGLHQRPGSLEQRMLYDGLFRELCAGSRAWRIILEQMAYHTRRGFWARLKVVPRRVRDGLASVMYRLVHGYSAEKLALTSIIILIFVLDILVVYLWRYEIGVVRSKIESLMIT